MLIVSEPVNAVTVHAGTGAAGHLIGMWTGFVQFLCVCVWGGGGGGVFLLLFDFQMIKHQQGPCMTNEMMCIF